MIATAKMAAVRQAEMFLNEVTEIRYRSDRRCPGPCVDKPEDLEGSCSAAAFSAQGASMKRNLAVSLRSDRLRLLTIRCASDPTEAGWEYGTTIPDSLGDAGRSGDLLA